MTLQQLEYVVAVAEHRHFLKAAEACRVTQPTLSAMVQKLEEELGVKIFDRRQKPLALTPVGGLVVEQARQMLAQARTLRERIDEAAHSLGGVLRIGVLPTIAPYLIPRCYAQLGAQLPQLELHIAEMKTADIKAALLRGDLDAGILAQIDGLEEMETHTLFYEQYFVYASPESPLHGHSSVRTDDLRTTPLWLLDEGHCFREQLVKFCHLKSAAKSKKAYNLGSIETFMRIVESGKGVTFIPELALEQLTEVQEELVRSFAHPIPTRDIILLTQKNFLRTSLRQLVIDKIRASVPAGMLRMNKTQQAL